VQEPEFHPPPRIKLRLLNPPQAQCQALLEDEGPCLKLSCKNHLTQAQRQLDAKDTLLLQKDLTIKRLKYLLRCHQRVAPSMICMVREPQVRNISEEEDDDESIYDAGLLPSQAEGRGTDDGGAGSPQPGTSGAPSREPREKGLTLLTPMGTPVTVSSLRRAGSPLKKYSPWSSGIGKGNRMRLIQLPGSMGKEA